MRILKKSFYSIASLACLLITLFFGYTVVRAEPVSIPNTFSPGSTISSSQMNANFAALKTGIEHNKAGAVCSAVNPSILSNHVLTGSVTDIVSVSITTPGSGTVFVTGTGVINNIHTINNSSVTQVYISQTSSNGSPFGITWSNSFGWQDGNYRAPFSVQSNQIISSSGTYTYYLTGRLAPSNTETTSIDGGYICALFFPN